MSSDHIIFLYQLVVLPFIVPFPKRDKLQAVHSSVTTSQGGRGRDSVTTSQGGGLGKRLGHHQSGKRLSHHVSKRNGLVPKLHRRSACCLGTRLVSGRVCLLCQLSCWILEWPNKLQRRLHLRSTLDLTSALNRWSQSSHLLHCTLKSL